MKVMKLHLTTTTETCLRVHSWGNYKTALRTRIKPQNLPSRETSIDLQTAVIVLALLQFPLTTDYTKLWFMCFKQLKPYVWLKDG